ncbi:T9SS type A sorting domain-containing protein [Spirosoma koreense]
MTKIRLPLIVLNCCLLGLTGRAQTLFNNASNLVAGSDNTGAPAYQPGTEVLASTPGQGVSLAPGGSYEHVGQFYVAANGIWNRTQAKDQSAIGTDYFGYAPLGIGANTAYLGRGIQGASPANGGKGTGRPAFGHLQLNSTGEFPLEGGMYITHSLVFNANGPGQPNVIATPNATSADSPLNAVVFDPQAIIQGSDHQSYIDGYASVGGVSTPFTLPIGDPAGAPYGLRPLTIDSPTPGTVTARYRHALQHPADALGSGIGSVSAMGDWPISAPEGTQVSVSLPALTVDASKASSLRLVGWNGSQWIALSSTATPGGCVGEGCQLSGTMAAGITDLAIGSTDRSTFGETGELRLTVWPNPTQRVLQVRVSSGAAIRRLQALDLQSRPVTGSIEGSTSLNTSSLASGSYILEVQTVQGQTLRTHFVKQP